MSEFLCLNTKVEKHTSINYFFFPLQIEEVLGLICGYNMKIVF